MVSFSHPTALAQLWTPTTSDIRNCEIGCLDGDAFTFTGASSVKIVWIQQNALTTLPEELLWNMTSLTAFRANLNVKLESLPERLFLGNSQLEYVDFDNCYALKKNRLPDGLFVGLTKLTTLTLMYTPFLNLPDMDDLTVRIVAAFSWNPCPICDIYCVGGCSGVRAQCASACMTVS